MERAFVLQRPAVVSHGLTGLMVSSRSHGVTGLTGFTVSRSHDGFACIWHTCQVTCANAIDPADFSPVP